MRLKLLEPLPMSSNQMSNSFARLLLDPHSLEVINSYAALSSSRLIMETDHSTVRRH